jgi:hypothetical protein
VSRKPECQDVPANIHWSSPSLRCWSSLHVNPPLLRACDWSDILSIVTLRQREWGLAHVLAAMAQSGCETMVAGSMTALHRSRLHRLSLSVIRVDTPREFFQFSLPFSVLGKTYHSNQGWPVRANWPEIFDRLESFQLKGTGDDVCRSILMFY